MMTATPATPPNLDPQQLWQAVTTRDPAYDGQFIYAVRSTGIYCRPVCPSRRPRPAQALFFANPADARRAGFRPCRRCHPDGPHPDAQLTRRACDYIDAHFAAQDTIPPAAQIGNAIGVTPSRLRRLFRNQTGLTPAQYARARRLDHFKSQLRRGADVTTAAYSAGYGSPSHIYETAAQNLGMTPATYRKGGAGAIIRYALTPSPLGSLLLAATETGICAVKLGDAPQTLIAELHAEFPAAQIIPAPPENPPENLRQWLAALLEYLHGSRPDLPLPLDVAATAFQWRVWRRLQAIPPGETRTYRQLAAQLNQPTASRAVGRACATNPVAPIIPCHRALRADGQLAGYRWGLHRKQALLDLERRQPPNPNPPNTPNPPVQNPQPGV